MRTLITVVACLGWMACSSSSRPVTPPEPAPVVVHDAALVDVPPALVLDASLDAPADAASSPADAAVVEAPNDAKSKVPPAPQTSCPKTPEGLLATCVAPQRCTFPTLECQCGPVSWCGGAAPPSDWAGRGDQWNCKQRTGCPFERPAAGSPCSREGQDCDYTCSCVSRAICRKHKWAIENGSCKPSAPPRNVGPPSPADSL